MRLHPISWAVRLGRSSTVVVAVGLMCGIARAEAPRIGDRAPPLALPDLEGAHVTVEAGRVTIVEFSATWCGPCAEALPHLARITSESGARLVIVDVAQSAAIVRTHYAGVALPSGTKIALDLDDAASQRWGRSRFPTTFVVDKEGIIRFINRGYGPGYAARIRDRVRALVDRR